jgi:hypothetical protein
MSIHFSRSIARIASAVVLAATFMAVPVASAAIVTLDFETPATGSTIPIAPVVTPFGTVTEGADNRCTPPIAPVSNPGGGTGNVLCAERTATAGGFLSLLLGFDANSITFNFDGRGGGGFQAEVLDANSTVLDTLLLGNGSLAGVATLSGAGIREFRFTDPISAFSAVDNVAISVSAAPEPSVLALLGVGLAALRIRRRRK